MNEGKNRSDDDSAHSVVKDKIDYLYGDLSKVPVATLKSALVAYKNFKINDGSLLRIEGELLKRKELKVDENLFSEN